MIIILKNISISVGTSNIQQPIPIQPQSSSSQQQQQRSSFINNAQIQLQAPHPAALFAAAAPHHHFAHNHHAIGIHPMLQAQPGSPFVAVAPSSSSSSSGVQANSGQQQSSASPPQNPSEFQPRASSAAPPFPRTSAAAAAGAATAFHQISSPICQPSTGALPVVPLLTSSQSFNAGAGANKPAESNRASFLAPRQSQQPPAASASAAASDRKPEELDAVANELLSEFVLKKNDNSSSAAIGLGTGWSLFYTFTIG